MTETKPANYGKRWTSLEEKQLTNRFKLGYSLAELCKVHKRSSLGILGRLVRLDILLNEGGRYYRTKSGNFSTEPWVDMIDNPAGEEVNN